LLSYEKELQERRSATIYVATAQIGPWPPHFEVL
jgi:hypothetical protein